MNRIGENRARGRYELRKGETTGKEQRRKGSREGRKGEINEEPIAMGN